MIPEFKTMPYVDFNQPGPREKMEKAIAYVQSQVGKEYGLIIDGEEIFTEGKIKSINPGNVDEIVGIHSKCTKELAERAMQSALKAFDKWKKVPGKVRARYLWKAASIMKERIYELSAWMVFEEGKNWLEAYADTCEAIDFLEFYGHQMVKLDSIQPLTRMEGVDNELHYISLGVGVVIPPWNFPCAIMAGMTTAAIVSGNSVLLKPASTAPTIARKFVDIMREVMLPPGVLNFIPGSGSEIGDFIVEHPKTRFIAFTGSMEVGLRIQELASKCSPGQIWVKRTILEMGGKDAIVVDNSAKLDEAATGIVASAFGFQGQKCSACSRAIVVKEVYDELLQLIIDKAKKITVGNVKQWENYMGPVIDKSAYAKIMEYIEIGKGEGRLVLGGEKASGNGYYIQPTIIADVDSNARIAQEEIFGPVLAYIKADNYDHALEIANGTKYGLTGAVFAMDRMKLERAREEFHVGNLYLNRKCTGALVDVEPFGGFNMSGTDSKAGGRDYLLLFTQAKSVSEKI
ncbi:L-glutamate gamma-semialdehyde dehydrogenase [bacterium]|nr:L-glutamate gamma-semialdehyde dehydrogenase [bacterium]